MMLSDLEHGVGRAAEPLLAEALLRRHDLDVEVEHRREAPAARDVRVERVRLVLRQHLDLEEAGVDEVRQHEVDEAIATADRHRRLGALGGERPAGGALHRRRARPTSTCGDGPREEKRRGEVMSSGGRPVRSGRQASEAIRYNAGHAIARTLYGALALVTLLARSAAAATAARRAAAAARAAAPAAARRRRAGAQADRHGRSLRAAQERRRPSCCETGYIGAAPEEAAGGDRGAAERRQRHARLHAGALGRWCARW